MTDRIGKPVSQRQLRVGEMIKQSLGMIFSRNEAKVPNLETNTITVTEVKMSQDLKIAKAYVLPLGGKDAESIIKKLKEYSFLYLILNNLQIVQENFHLIENVKLFTKENKLIFENIFNRLAKGENFSIDEISIDKELIDKIFKFMNFFVTVD